MSKADKLLKRLLSCPKNFTYGELKTLFAIFGYEELQGSGSRVCFSNGMHKIKLHKPHPGNVLKRYQLDLIIDELTAKGFIKNNEKNE